MSYFGVYNPDRKFISAGGTTGEGNPTFDFTQAVCIDQPNFIYILGHAKVSDVNIKCYQGQLPPEISAVRPQHYQLRILKNDFEESYKGTAKKKIATEIDRFIVERLQTFAHAPESFADMTDEDFKTVCIGLNLDLGANALDMVTAYETKTLNGASLDEVQLLQVERQVIDFPVMFGQSFTLADVKTHLSKIINAGGSTGYKSGGSYTPKVSDCESNYALLKTILHNEFCDKAVVKTADEIKLGQVATDLTMMESKKASELKFLLGLIFN